MVSLLVSHGFEAVVLPDSVGCYFFFDLLILDQVLAINLEHHKQQNSFGRALRAVIESLPAMSLESVASRAM